MAVFFQTQTTKGVIMGATCDMGFDHPDDDAAAIAAEAEAGAVADAAESGAAADVEVARLQADRDVAVEKIRARGMDEETAATIAALQARVDVLESGLAPPPSAEPDPVVIAEPAPEPEPEPAPAPPDTEPAPEPERKRGYWGSMYQ
jgi:outer membrane biosynthesis protein TonB